MSNDPNKPHHQPNEPDANLPPANALGGGLGDILGQILGGGGQRPQAEQPEEDPRYQDPRYQQRQTGRRVPQQREEEQDAGGGGLGGILGQILGGGGGGQQQPQREEPEEDPRYQDPRYQQREPQQPRGRQQQPRQEAEEGGGGLGGLLGGILGGGNEAPQQADPRRSGVISQGGGGPSVGGGLLKMLLGNPRILMFLVIAAGSVFMYFAKNKQEYNPITDEVHRVPWEPAKDVPLGMQAAPQMIAQHGGEHPDPNLQAQVDQIGNALVRANAVGDWEPAFRQYNWDFHLLRDPETINAFALPGGQIFFTYGLFKRLKTQDEVAGVLGHEIAHVIARHSAQQMAKGQLINGLIMAGASATSSDGQNSGQMAQMIGSMVNMKYGRADETQADTLGTQFMINAKFNPEGIMQVMRVLKAEMGGSRQPEIMSSHPDPGNREEHIKQVIEAIRAGRLEGPKSVAQPIYVDKEPVNRR